MQASRLGAGVACRRCCHGSSSLKSYSCSSFASGPWKRRGDTHLAARRLSTSAGQLLAARSAGLAPQREAAAFRNDAWTRRSVCDLAVALSRSVAASSSVDIRSEHVSFVPATRCARVSTIFQAITVPQGVSMWSTRECAVSSALCGPSASNFHQSWRVSTGDLSKSGANRSRP